MIYTTKNTYTIVKREGVDVVVDRNGSDGMFRACAPGYGAAGWTAEEAIRFALGGWRSIGSPTQSTLLVPRGWVLVESLEALAA